MVRIFWAFNSINKEQKIQEEKVNKFEMVDEKSAEIIEQEKNAQNEDKSSTDLHNLYK